MRRPGQTKPRNWTWALGVFAFLTGGGALYAYLAGGEGDVLVGAMFGAFFGAGAAWGVYHRHRPRATVFVIPHPWGMRILVLLLLALPLFVAYSVLRDALNDEAPGFLIADSQVEAKPVSTLRGVRLGEGFAGVSARRGPFVEAAPDGVLDPFGGSVFVNREEGIRLAVHAGTVVAIAHVCREGDATALNRIRCGSWSHNVRNIFAGGAKALCGSTGLVAWDVARTGTRYIAERSAISAFVITDPRRLESSANGSSAWRPC